MPLSESILFGELPAPLLSEEGKARRRLEEIQLLAEKDPSEFARRLVVECRSYTAVAMRRRSAVTHPTSIHPSTSAKLLELWPCGQFIVAKLMVEHEDGDEWLRVVAGAEDLVSFDLAQKLAKSDYEPGSWRP